MKEISLRAFAVKPWDPRNLGWWLWLLPTIVGAAIMIWYLAPSALIFPATLIVGLCCSAVTLTIWWLGLRLPQIFSRIAVSGGVAAVLWGAGAATGLYALPANRAIITLMGQIWGVDFAASWGAAVAAPLTEETGKLLGIVAVLLAGRARLRNPIEGFLLGAYVGLGFTIAENVLYGFNGTLLNFGEAPALATVAMYFLRTVLFGVISHALFTGAAGLALGWLWSQGRKPRYGWALAAFTVAYGVHFLWNSPLLEFILLRFLVLLSFPALIYGLIKVARRDEADTFRAYLWPEVTSGFLQPGYVTAVGHSRYLRRRHYRRVAARFGPAAVTAQRRLDGLLMDLWQAIAERDVSAQQWARHRIATTLGLDRRQ